MNLIQTVKITEIMNSYEILSIQERGDSRVCVLDMGDGKTISVIPSGAVFWYYNELRHREDGPAYEHPDGSTCWYLYGNPVTQKEHAMGYSAQKGSK